MHKFPFNWQLAFPFAFFLLFSSSCAFRLVSSTKDITYLAKKESTQLKAQKLDVYGPKNVKEPKNVLIFIHGGNWNSGDKETYRFLGNRWARKGVVMVIISYPLSPQADYRQMTASAARAVQWVHQNIAQYGGDPDKIFVSGHSAGGHIAALLTLRQDYFDSLQMQNPIKGAVLIDAAGLDMYAYLRDENLAAGHTFYNTFTKDPENWKDATPLYHLRPDMPPLLIYRGENTYPSIIKSTESFVSALKKYRPNPNYHVQEGKKHIPMILQFFWTWNPRYKEIKAFMNAAR